MGLNCLLLTKDATLLAAIQNGFSATNAALEMRADPTTAIELSDRRHLDGFVIDSISCPSTSDLIAQIRKSRSNKQSILVVVVNATTSASMAIDAGADFVIAKPVQDKQLQNILDIALPRMEREHRRYFRHKIDLPVELINQIWRDLLGKTSECKRKRSRSNPLRVFPGERSSDNSIRAPQRPLSNLPGKSRCSLE